MPFLWTSFETGFPIFVILIWSLQNSPTQTEPCDLLYLEEVESNSEVPKTSLQRGYLFSPRSSLCCARNQPVKSNLCLFGIYPTEFWHGIIGLKCSNSNFNSDWDEFCKSPVLETTIKKMFCRSINIISEVQIHYVLYLNRKRSLFNTILEQILIESQIILKQNVYFWKKIRENKPNHGSSFLQSFCAYSVHNHHFNTGDEDWPLSLPSACKSDEDREWTGLAQPSI